MKNLGVEQAIAIAGSQMALAKKCGRAQSMICDWLNGKIQISPEYIPDLVAATDVQVPAYQVRPDLPKLFLNPEQTA